MCSELQSGALPLLVPTPNNKNNNGLNRECWIPNPSATRPSHIEMFKFFGRLLGTAIRSTSTLQLDLPPLFWKLLLNQVPDPEDLRTIDGFTFTLLHDLRQQAAQLTAEEFEAGVDQSFVTLLSNGSEVQLCKGGKAKQVTKDNLEEYIKLVIEARLNEFAQQMKVIKAAVEEVLPPHILYLLSWDETEKRATGDKTIDLDILKSITEYSVSILELILLRIALRAMKQ